VAKSYLSILAGLAWDRGLIKDSHERVRLTVDDGGFASPHNEAITWITCCSRPRSGTAFCGTSPI